MGIWEDVPDGSKDSYRHKALQQQQDAIWTECQEGQ